ncbi:hypothetical protein LMG7974_01571 [Campylobacter majalis]|uniref:Uncharacterized protein n=1 Tax=Campylobacter majalis TaxID=2790656 RepID=A0ABM8Q9F5_9BACT|nr:hypothetical protein [Campylobacter majalis]CAD7289494.1 hypothetical protein LMG7974_01571 [Campylobacter majalis]
MNNNFIKEISCNFEFGGNSTLELNFKNNIYIIEQNLYNYTIKKNGEVVFDQKFNIEANKDILNINFLDKDFQNAIIAYCNNTIDAKSFITGSDFVFRDLSSIFKKLKTEKLKENLLKHKMIIDKIDIYSTYSDESRAIAVALAFFRDEKTQKSTADIAIELNLLYPNLFMPITEQDIHHIKTLDYISKQNGDTINYNQAMTRHDIAKKLNNIIDLKSYDEEMGYKYFADAQDSNTSIETNIDNKIKTRKRS